MKPSEKRHRAVKYPALVAAFLLGSAMLCWLGTRRNDARPAAKDTAQAHTPTASAIEPAKPIADFQQWLSSWSTAAPANRDALSETGLRLARQRRATMESLIRTNPREALSQAVPLDVWKSLPAALQAEVEEPFSVIADYRVMPVCINGSPDAARVREQDEHPAAIREINFGPSSTAAAFVYGRREGLGSKNAAPFQGIRLGKLSALREEVFHELSKNEITVAESIYPIANRDADRDFATDLLLGPEPVTALAGGKVYKFADQATLETFSTQIAKLDETPGPKTGAALLSLPFPLNGSNSGGFNIPEAINWNNTLGIEWTETKKKVFIIRCDFSDKTNASFPVIGQAPYQTLLNGTISDTIEDYSYGKTWIEATVSTDITRLPQPADHYNNDDGNGTGSTLNSQLLTDAKSTYQTAHPEFVASDYDIIGVWFVDINMTGSGVAYAGLASIDGPNLWIQDTNGDNIDVDVHVHEFGHNYGLGHSSSWTPSVGSTNATDPAGSSTEYGDIFDVMGDGTVPEGAFHSEAKQRLNWLATGDWTDATAGGNATYRIYRIDDDATTGSRGLRVTRGADEYFWLSYRRLFSNSWLKAGANIVWKRAAQSRSWLIDTTPGSIAGTADKNDSSIAIGRTFTNGNINITPLARGGTAPQEYLDIRVNTGPFAGNVAPVVILNGPTSIAARQTAIFTTEATDANGDELAYSWDFGQGFTFDNHPEASFSWNTGGTFTVKVTVSDMKGGTMQATKTVTVTDPIGTWTTRSNTATGDFKALVASPTKVIAVGSNFAGTFKGPVTSSPDGITWTSNELPVNQHGYGGTWDGSQFVIAGIDFTGASAVGGIFTSPTANNGTWTTRHTGGSYLRSVAYGGGVYIAVGENGTIRRSTNGTTWNLVTSGTTRALNSVAYGGGKFVVMGHLLNTTGSPIVLTSPDGLTWTDTTAGSGVESWQDLRNVIWTNDRFIASGWYGKVRCSLDLGTTFSTTRTTSDDTPGLAYGNGVWFAAGRRNANTGSEVDIDMVSSDGVNWTDLTTPALDNRISAAFFNNSFITISANRVIRQSGTISQAAAGYGFWRDTYFPDHGPATNPGGDADYDGIVNLLEYSLASAPNSASGTNGPTALPQAVIASSESLLSDRLALQISMPEPAAADLIYTVEAATDLGSTWTTIATKTGTGSWVWNGGGTSRIVTAAPSGGRVLTKIGDSVPIASDPERFLRLRTRVNQ